jgi:NAD+ synthase
MDGEQVRQILTQFIKDQTHKAGYSRVVIGLSGGLDSAVAAYLSVEALGKENCVGVFLPHSVSHPESLRDAQGVAQRLGIRTRRVDISPLVEPFQKGFHGISAVQLGNIMARVRMIVLYQISAEENALIVGTSNKSEILLGYGTLHGDLACAFNPLGGLYKTQIRVLAKHLNVSEEIQRKTPSADLWAGQSDEGELGITYAEADRFLVRWVDKGYTRDQLLKEGFASDFADRVAAKVISQQFKSKLPPIAKLSRGADSDRPLTWPK